MEGCFPPSSIKYTTIYHLYFINPPFSIKVYYHLLLILYHFPPFPFYQALFSPPDRRT